MRMLWQRLRAAWATLTGSGAVASVAFGLLVFASVLASLAIPRESVALRTAALQHVIAASPAADRIVVGTVGETSMGGSVTVQASDIAAVGASLRARLAAGGVPVAGGSPAWAGLTSAYVPVRGAARAAGYSQPQVELTYRTALARYSRVLAGRLPAGGAGTGQENMVQAAVTTATAARLGLRVGARLTAGDGGAGGHRDHPAGEPGFHLLDPESRGGQALCWRRVPRVCSTGTRPSSSAPLGSR